MKAIKNSRRTNNYKFYTFRSVNFYPSLSYIPDPLSHFFRVCGSETTLGGRESRQCRPRLQQSHAHTGLAARVRSDSCKSLACETKPTHTHRTRRCRDFGCSSPHTSLVWRWVSPRTQPAGSFRGLCRVALSDSPA